MRIRNSLCKHASSRTAAVRIWARGAVLLGLVAGAASAQTPDAFIRDAGQAATVASPWTPEIVQSLEPYAGPLGLDHFAGPNNADEVGRVTAALSNGDRVVAGLVPPYGSTDPANGLWNLGLARYSQAGRVAWTNPGEFGHFGNQYIVYPGDSAPFYQYIRDVKVLNGIIYVLLDQQIPTQAGLGRQDVKIVAFGEDGDLKEILTVFGFPFASDPEDFYGAQMALMSNNHMIVTATDYDGTSSYLAVNRLTISAGGFLTQDSTWGDGYGGGNISRLIRYPSNVAYTAGYAVNQVGFATQDDFYVAGSYEPQGDSDVVVLKISSLTGAYKPEFGNNGFVGIDFAQLNGSHDDYAAGLYVYQDDVYVGAQVAQKCHPGIGMAKLDGATGDLISAFGGSGKIVFGGQGNAQFCWAGATDDVPFAMSATGGRLGIVGYHHEYLGTGFPHFYDPMLGVVNAVNGTVLDLARHPVTRADGSRLGDAILFSVYGGPNPNSPFTVAGEGRDTSAGNTLSYLSGWFAPDRIFGNGFD